MADPQEVPGATDPPRRSTRAAYLHKKSQEQERDRSRHSRGLRSIKSTLTPPAPYTGPRRQYRIDRLRLRAEVDRPSHPIVHGHPDSYPRMSKSDYNRKWIDVAANGIRSSIDVPLQETKTWKDDDGYICTNNSAAWKDDTFCPRDSKPHFQKYNTFPCPPGCPDNLYMCTIKQNGRTDRYWKLFGTKGFCRRPLPFMDCDSKGNHMQGVDQVVLRSKVAVDKYIVQKWQWNVPHLHRAI